MKKIELNTGYAYPDLDYYWYQYGYFLLPERTPRQLDGVSILIDQYV